MPLDRTAFYRQKQIKAHRIGTDRRLRPGEINV